MNIISPPYGWTEVTEAAFKEFLATGPDYVRTGYIGAVKYYFRHNQQHFATVIELEGAERIYVLPSLLAPEQ